MLKWSVTDEQNEQLILRDEPPVQSPWATKDTPDRVYIKVYLTVRFSGSLNLSFLIHRPGFGGAQVCHLAGRHRG